MQMKNFLKYVIYAGLFLVPFVPFFVSSELFFPYITTKAFAWRIIVEVIFASWLALVLVDASYRPKRSLILYALIAFVAIIGLADLFGVAPVKSFWSNFERMEGFVALLHLGAFFLVTGSVFNENLWKKWWNTSLAASLLMVLYSLLQLSGTIDIHQGESRVDGTFGNASYLAVYLLIHIFIAIFFAIRSRSKGLRWTYGILILGQVLVLYYTATRGAILGLLGGLFLLALLNIRNNEEKNIKRASVGVIVALVATISLFIGIKDSAFVQNSPVLVRFASINMEDIKTEGRSFVWPIALEGIKERPLLGWGQENFNYVFNQHYKPEMYKLEPWFDRAHNIFLDWGIAGGLLGLLSYISLYVVLLLSIWKKEGSFSHVEKTVLTGLLAGYFFHNLFVFDHLLSYILFAALLAYVHSRVGISPKKNLPEISRNKIGFIVPASAIVLFAMIYFINWRPLQANADLINALNYSRSENERGQALGHFQSAFSSGTLGRGEAVEWIATSISPMTSASVPEETRSNYIGFAKNSIVAYAEDFPKDARYQLLAGRFLSAIGEFDESGVYFERAETLIPGKQAVYLEEGVSLINSGNKEEALLRFKKAYDLAPSYEEAEVMYLVGAIHAGDESLIKELSSAIRPEIFFNEDRIAKALFDKGRFIDLAKIYEERLKTKKDNPEIYLALAVSYFRSGQISRSLAVLDELGKNLPQYKAQADGFKKSILEGKI